MKIAIIGMGGIGSTYALHLARHGHDVTAIARGRRLQQLESARAIVTSKDERVAVTVAPELDTSIAYDLVLVTVLGHQVDSLLETLKRSAAKKVMFAFNLFEPLDRLRAAVGEERFIFGFPAMLASLDEGRLSYRVVSGGPQTTLSTDPEWARTLSEAGIPTIVPDDIEGWLHTHAALVAPFMAAMHAAHARGAGITFADARRHASAVREAMNVVSKLGYSLTPRGAAWLSRRETLVAMVLWIATRTASLRAVASGSGPGEARALLDAIVAAAPDESSAVRSVRP